jgi:hypothetical protein
VLRVAVMLGIVTAAVRKVDATDESNITFGCCRVADDHELLMMRAAKSHPLVKKDFTPGRVAFLAQMAVLLGAEAEPVRVRPPEQSLDAYASARSRREDDSDLGLRGAVKKLIGVAAPIGEEQLVPGLQLTDGLQKPSEICRAVNEGLDPVSNRPCQSVRMPAVDLGGVVASFAAGKEPAGKDLVHCYCHCYRTRRTIEGVEDLVGGIPIVRRSL